MPSLSDTCYQPIVSHDGACEEFINKNYSHHTTGNGLNCTIISYSKCVRGCHSELEDKESVMDPDVEMKSPTAIKHCPCCPYYLVNTSSNNCGHNGEVAVQSEGVCCDVEWRLFTEYTTLHGLRYIWQKDSSCFRRLLWLSLTLVCLSIMSYQIIERAIYFYEWPVTVNVKINYNDTLEFPTLTFCNQNAFRATATESMGQYALIADMFDDATVFQPQDLHLYNATNLTFEYLYTATGHRKEDIIIKCDWRGERCGPENFTEIATDHGICYTFNNADSKRLVVDSPGSKEGLTMTLNIEQYEYMPGPNDAAGIKILLHHRNQYPNVKELGVVLSAGTHSLVGMKMLSIENLPKPHGQCRSPKPLHFKSYSTESCGLECITILLRNQCGCRLYHMPNIDGNTQVCTLSQYFSCYQPNLRQLRDKSKSACSCPVPCKFVLFEPSLSYAASSPLVTDRFLATTNRTILKSKYDAARDVTHRLRPEKRETFSNLIKKLRRLVDKIQNLLTVEIENKLIRQRDAVRRVSDETGKLYNETVYLYRYQEYMVQKDFIRARDAMNERTFSVVAFDMQEFVFNTEDSIRSLSANETDSEVIRRIIFIDLMRRLNGRIDIIQRALQNYTELRDALVSGQPIFNYRFRDEPRNNTIHIVPVPLFHTALNMSQRILRSTSKFGDVLNELIHHLNEYKTIGNKTFSTGEYNKTEVFLNSVQYLRYCRTYLQFRDQVLYDIPKKMKSMLVERSDEMETAKQKFDTSTNNIMIQLRGISWQAQMLSNSHLTMKAGAFSEIIKGLHMAEDFLNGTISKKDVARQFLMGEIQDTKNLLKLFFNELRSRGHEVYDDWTEIRRAASDIWTLAIDDINLHKYYEFINKSDVMVNKTEKLEEIADTFDGYRQQLDLRKEMRHVDSEFLDTLATMLKEMLEYKNSEELNADFLKDNILKMSIFYKELSYEQITQQSAYDVFALLCDVGGSLGLFIGASVISVFEILDLVGFTYLDRLMKRRGS